MKAEYERNGSTVIFRIGEELTALNSPQLSDIVKSAIDDSVDKVIFDVTEMPYTSSAGLRVLLSVKYIMDDRKGSMEVIGICNEVKRIFDDTGFTRLLNEG